MFCSFIVYNNRYFWGPVADIFGRRKAFIGAASIISAAGLASGLAPSYAWLLALRGLVGFGLGGSSVPFDLLAEFCPPKQRCVPNMMADMHVVVYIDCMMVSVSFLLNYFDEYLAADIADA